MNRCTSPRGRADRHLNPNFVRVLVDRVGDQPVDSERREQRKSRKSSKQQNDKPSRRDGLLDDLLERPEVIQRLPENGGMVR